MSCPDPRDPYRARDKQNWKLGDERFAMSEARRKLAQAQQALAHAEARDPEAAEEARRALAEALQRLRALT